MSTPTNNQVIDAFYRGVQLGNRSLTSTGDKLFSYHTCIAQHIPSTGNVIVNRTRYSVATSRHQNTACAAASLHSSRGASALRVVLNPVPRGEQDLLGYKHSDFTTAHA